VVVVFGLLLGLSCSFAVPAPPPVETVNDSSAAQFDEFLSGQTLSVMSTEGIGEPTLLRLLAHPDIRPIREITIRDQQLTAQSVQAIMGADSTAGIHTLHLSGNPLGDAGLQALARSPRLAQIETLHLQKVGAGPVGIAALAASPYLKAKNLALGWQSVGDQGAKALVAATQVAHLRLESAEVGTEGAVALIEGGRFESLSLIKNPVHLEGLTAVSSHLQSLSLIECPLSAQDIELLASAEAPSLTSLSLKWSRMEDAGLSAIMGASWFGQLQSLDLSASKASAQSRRALIAAYGEGGFLSIYRKDL
jgi:hypothetical protein